MIDYGYALVKRKLVQLSAIILSGSGCWAGAANRQIFRCRHVRPRCRRVPALHDMRAANGIGPACFPAKSPGLGTASRNWWCCRSIMGRSGFVPVGPTRPAELEKKPSNFCAVKVAVKAACGGEVAAGWGGTARRTTRNARHAGRSRSDGGHRCGEDTGRRFGPRVVKVDRQPPGGGGGADQHVDRGNHAARLVAISQ